MPRVNRNSNPCDGCTLRRVRCEATRPCSECRARGIECTTLQTRQRRGPKGGPRVKTKKRVEDFQRSIREAQAGQMGIQTEDRTETQASLDQAPPDRTQRSNDGGEPTDPHGRLPLEEYFRFIEIFRKRVYSIWPVNNLDDLPAKLGDPDDYEAYALAASLCASTIAQLRLPEHTTRLDTTSSLRFARDCLRMRDLYDYRETYSLSSVLIPLFLHGYYSNSDKIRTAGFFLRETATFVHALELGRPQTYEHMSQEQKAIRIRLYWLVFVTERTFAAEHGMPAVLQVIDTLPSLDPDLDSQQLTPAFLSLMRLFAYLEEELLDCKSFIPLERQKLVTYQAALRVDSHDRAPSEVQRVDLFVTRQWVRLLIWEHTARHFAMTRDAEDPAFSLLLPVHIGREMLSVLSLTTDDTAIRSHGYGLELKVFRVADAMLDIVACDPPSARRGYGDGGSMLVGTGDILQSLQFVLYQVGGRQSTFVERVQMRMTHLGMTTGAWPYSMLSLPYSEEEEAHLRADRGAVGGSDSHFDGPRVEEVVD